MDREAMGRGLAKLAGSALAAAVAACCAVLALLVCAGPAHAERRIALVIGIDRYQHLPPLEKAVADARAVAQVLLNDLGFSTVLTLENPDRRQMSRKLAELDGTIHPGDTVFLFFSGHGVALGAENVLLPADMPKPGHGQDGMVRDDGFAVDGIVRRIQGRGAKVSMFVLDACRDNPFEQAGTRNIGATRGLARIDAPQGVFVLFSAGLGQKALDKMPGADPVATSVFTRQLIPALQTPGLSHVQIAKRVQQEVDALARGVGHGQQPAYYDQIIGDVYLHGALLTAPPSLLPVNPVPLQQAPQPPEPASFNTVAIPKAKAPAKTAITSDCMSKCVARLYAGNCRPNEAWARATYGTGASQVNARCRNFQSQHCARSVCKN